MKKIVILFLIVTLYSTAQNRTYQNPIAKSIDYYLTLPLAEVIKENRIHSFYFNGEKQPVSIGNNEIKNYIPSPYKGDKSLMNIKFDFSDPAKPKVISANYTFNKINCFYDGSRYYLRASDSDNNYFEWDLYKPFFSEKLVGIREPDTLHTPLELFKEFDAPKYIKNIVENRVNNWLKKGEFEKLSLYNERIANFDLNEIVKKFQDEELAALSKQMLGWMSREFGKSFSLKNYDSENESFLIDSDYFGEIAFKVPISEASYFKENFGPKPMRKFLDDDFRLVLLDNKLVIAHLTFIISKNVLTIQETSKEYSYDIDDKIKYVKTEIAYNFDKVIIDVAQINNSKTVPFVPEEKNITVGKSTVDINIPSNPQVANRYALIIGNEDYQSMQRTLDSEQNVKYAVNDATIFKEYATKTLGVAEENVTFIANGTAGQMSQQIDKVVKILTKLGEQAELIVYYAGHGIPDEVTKVPYIIPVDVNAANLDLAIKLNEFYSKLSATGAKRIMVFMDACFTGGGRTEGLIASRGVKVKPKDDALKGNIVVVSASSGIQSALPYDDEKHGMFSYYLFKKLQESKGDVTVKDLFSDIQSNVSLQSLKINNKEQDPTINFSSEIENQYGNWNLKN